MAYCGEHILSATIETVKTAVSLHCRSWGCQECAALRQRQLVAKGLSGKPNRFVTLTSRRNNKQTAIEAARNLANAWKIIFRQIKKQHPKEKPEFLAVFERTQTGWPHLHILYRGPWLHQHWLSQRMGELTNSPIVDVRAVIDQGRTAAYVAKYTAKGPGKFGTLKRYWTSKAYELENKIKDRKQETWNVQRMTLRKWCEMWRTLEWTVTELSTTKAEARQFPPPRGLQLSGGS